jgi:uncharacterized YigZ family protein
MSKYKTIQGESLGEFREKGSKFLAYAFPIQNESDVAPHIETLRKAHPKACHWCYAWRLGLDKNLYRANDDGEPSGTAGRPILGQIDSFQLTNVLVIVVRYFGGTLLGTTGLIQAYKESTMEAFQNANIIEKTVCDYYRCTFDYSIMSDVMNAIKKLELEISKKDFSESAFIEVAVPIDKTNATFLQFKALILKKTLEEVKSIEHIGGIHWGYLFTL